MRFALSAATLVVLAGCAAVTPQLSHTPHAATGAQAVLACDALAARFAHAGTRIASTERIAGGQLKLPGVTEAMPEHCVVKGAMNERTGADGKPYAIGFEMRLPTAWNGRFLYQANGGLDGFVT